MTNQTFSALPSTDERPIFVNDMFTRIAPTYDLMNRVMTFGFDQGWRRELLGFCELPPRGLLLDVGTGTGDIAYAAKRQYPGVQAVGADFTYEMMAAGVDKVPGYQVPFTQADVFHLPYDTDSFDAVTCGFLVRNVDDRVAAFREMTRVTKPGGKVVCLEITPPDNTLLGPLFSLYFFRIVPLVGSLISGDGQAYAYLPNSTVDFPAPEMLQIKMEQAGLRNVFFVERMLGTVAIHVGTKFGREALR